MADASQVKKTTVNVLFWVEKVSSVASSFIPLLGIVSTVVAVVRKGLQDDESLPMEEDFQSLQEKMETISEKNRQCLQQIQIDEVNETLAKYEDFIKKQYEKFVDMVTQVKKDPATAGKHMDAFVPIYEGCKANMSLDVFYRSVMGEGSVFGRPLLQVYLKACDRDRNIMEHRCSYLNVLFYKGLIALMAYNVITKDDVKKEVEKWARQMQEVQTKMEEVLKQCKD
ncbi:hypothetical protein N1851_024685 [Merluccius polli]|uniref:Rapunzel 2 n=1 Tax=Merluccius polli TaxID=89951 RepID=A0AA47MEU2_MERPO|nr:hypothetical protein N1851_024685 [Merluccius polli]